MTLGSRLRQHHTEAAAIKNEIAVRLRQEKGRSRAALNRELHMLRRGTEPQYLYASQAGQDMIVDRLLGGKSGGTFVDVGAYDGVTGSNSLFFEQIRGWSGVLVEPVPSQIQKARVARKCDCLQLAVSDAAGEAEFIAVTKGFTQMSGLAQSYDAQTLAQVRNDPRHVEELVQVQTKRLSDILTDVGILHPDFVSLDIEGGEVAVLRDFPFGDHRVQVWAIENNTGDSVIASIMRDAGYDLVDFAGPDEIYRLR